MSEHWDDKKRRYLNDRRRTTWITGKEVLGLHTDKTVSLICPTTIGIWYGISKEDCRY
ncbi:hypothetical protein [Wolbachia pipientis]|uniref:hypothetical protein n=1 Tax=Wolbachia pipientis TaxID=955 RepID=UPI002030702E|nr:hypothetical protein [Wolbachia pipientis]